MRRGAPPSRRVPIPGLHAGGLRAPYRPNLPGHLLFFYEKQLDYVEKQPAYLPADACTPLSYLPADAEARAVTLNRLAQVVGTQAALCERQRAPRGGAEGHLDGLRKRLVSLVAHLQERSSASSSLAQRARCCANALALLDVFIGARGVNPLARLCAADDAHAGEISLLSTNAVYAFICFYEIDGAACRAACI